jgi:hypothetical protein
MSVQNTLSPEATQHTVTQSDITRALGDFCFIRLDNGDEAFYYNGFWLASADGESNEPSVLGLAMRAARAGGKHLRCFELPVPEDKEWCWDDVVTALACCAITRDLRGELIVTGSETRHGRGIHVCNDRLLSGINSNLWFPLNPTESWFSGIERVLMMNGVAENVVRIDSLRDCAAYHDWKVVYNRKVTD